MRRKTFALLIVVAALGIAGAGCGGEEEVSPTPETVTGTTPTETEPTETTTTETEPTDTEPTETETETETTPTETEPGATDGDPVAGKEVFLGTAACGSCHALADAGTSGTIGPDLDASKPSVDLAVDRVTNGRGQMPPFAGTLSEQQIADVAAYVSQAAGG